jgi:hypothetical protein
MRVYNVAQVEPIADTEHSWRAVRALALKALELDALGVLRAAGFRRSDPEGDPVLRGRATTVAVATLAAALPAVIRERMSLPPTVDAADVLRPDQMSHRSLASSGSFPKAVAAGLDAAPPRGDEAPLKLWLTVRAAQELGLRGRPGELTHVAIAAIPRPMLNTAQLKGGGDVAAAPVRFGTFAHLPNDTPEFDELVALVARRGWKTGLFLTRAQLEDIGAVPRAGEQPFQCGGGGVVPSDAGAGDSGALTLVPARSVEGALKAAHAEVRRAMELSDPATTAWLPPDLASELAAALAKLAAKPSPPAKAQRVWPADAPTFVHRRAFTGLRLTGSALASVVALNAMLPEHQRDTWWVTTGELEAHQLAFDPASTPRAQVADIRGASPRGGTQSDAFADAVFEAAMASEGHRSTLGLPATQRVAEFYKQDLFHAEQLENPNLAFAASRDLALMRRFAASSTASSA